MDAISSKSIKALLVAGIHDWVMLDEVTWEVTGGDLSEVKREATLRTLDYLYSQGLMVPGDLGESGFEDWSGSPSDWLAKSQSELERMDWKPMGAGFYLRLTRRGDVAARGVKSP